MALRLRLLGNEERKGCTFVRTKVSIVSSAPARLFMVGSRLREAPWPVFPLGLLLRNQAGHRMEQGVTPIFLTLINL